MLVRSTPARKLVVRAAVLAACACALPLLVPQAAFAAPARGGSDARKSDARKSDAGTTAATRTAKADKKAKADSASGDAVLVGGQGGSKVFRNLLVGGGVGAAAGSAALLGGGAAAHASTADAGATVAALPPIPTPGSTASASTPTVGASAGTSTAAGSTAAAAPSAPMTPAALGNLTPSADPVVTVNPEPASVALVGAGALLLGGAVRRRRSNAA